jgi:PAS domain S-box-containing protein
MHEPETSVRVLLVEDNPADALIILELLRDGGKGVFNVTHADRLDVGIRELNRVPDVVLLDLNLSDSTGMETFRAFRRHAVHMPIILLTHMNDEALAAQALSEGGQDYLVKGMSDPRVLTRAIRYAIERKRAEMALQQYQQHLEEMVLWRTRELRQANQHLQQAEEQHRQTGEELRQSEGRFRNVFNHSPLGIVVASPDFTIIDANPAMCRLLGYSREEMIRIGVAGISRPEEMVRDAPMLQHLARNEMEVYRTEKSYCRKGGRWVDGRVTVSAVRSEHGALLYYLAMVEDVTDAKRAEAEHRLVETRRHGVQRMESLWGLAGGVAHDFNNILTGILGYTELALMSDRLDDEVRGHLTEIMAQGKRAAELVSRIMAFSRQGARECRPIRLDAVIRDAVLLLHGGFPPTVEVRTLLNEQCGAVMADATQIQQVVMNLGANARDAIDGRSGLVEIRLDEVTLGQEHVSALPDLLPGRHALITVRDSGCGIEADHLDRIFEPYFSTKRSGIGTGLGLATVLGVVRSHHGAIVAESVPGKGSTFKVYLPVTNEPVVGQESVLEPGTAPEGTERVLFVDDLLSAAHLAKIGLERLGYRVDVFTHSPAALQAFLLRPEYYDVVITDQLMPELSGVELARCILDVRGDVPIILCTGYSDRLNGDQAKACGIREFLFKPVLTRDLGRVIRKVLARNKVLAGRAETRLL